MYFCPVGSVKYEFNWQNIEVLLYPACWWSVVGDFQPTVLRRCMSEEVRRHSAGAHGGVDFGFWIWILDLLDSLESFGFGKIRFISFGGFGGILVRFAFFRIDR